MHFSTDSGFICRNAYLLKEHETYPSPVKLSQWCFYKDDLKMRTKEQLRRNKNLNEASSEGWTQITKFHWFRLAGGYILSYWPATGKFIYKGKTMYGGVEGFISKQLKE